MKILPLFLLAASLFAAERLPLSEIKNKCVSFSEIKIGTGELDARECKVTESGQLGVVEGERYFYALYCLLPSGTEGHCGDNGFSGVYHAKRGLAVFIQRGDFAEIAFERADPSIGVIYYEKPEIVEVNKTDVLILNIAVDGTGAGNESEYFALRDHKWQPIEAESWELELGKKIPAGLEMRKGIWPDLTTMTAGTGLYKPDDANCCPTGGEAKVDLALENNKFVLKSVSFSPSRER
jgi:hypothetical protein